MYVDVTKIGALLSSAKIVICIFEFSKSINKSNCELTYTEKKLFLLTMKYLMTMTRENIL